jgi:transposase
MPQPFAPVFSEESIYIGIDIGKAKHIAGFVSATLLERHQRFEGCPTFTFSQSREGFHALLERIRSLAPLEHCFVLMEQTGHYHKLLEQFLVELDLPVYVMHVQRRPVGLIKTDKRDALGLANHLYNLLAKGIQVGDKLQLIRRAFPPSEAASRLKSLTRHRYELIQESTQRKNQLTAIADELFPELTQICKDPNLPTPLALREAFPTPTVLATAAFSVVKARRIGFRPSDADLARLQALARTSIGIKEAGRQQGLVFEQAQLIAELRVIRQHLAALEQEIARVVAECREGQILRSIPAIGPLQAAAILATIGTIANFRSAAALKAYFGWAPTLTQSGTTLNASSLTKGGSRMMKQTMYLIAWQAVRTETEWAKTYQRLVPLKCPYDERLQTYKGRGKVLGRIAGAMISTIYALLRTDYERLSHLAPGAKAPDPLLYDAERHHQHRTGHYTPTREPQRGNRLVIHSGS